MTYEPRVFNNLLVLTYMYCGRQHINPWSNWSYSLFGMSWQNKAPGCGDKSRTLTILFATHCHTLPHNCYNNNPSNQLTDIVSSLDYGLLWLGEYWAMGDCQTILHYLSTVKLDKSIQWSTFYILLSFDHFIFISRFNSTGENNVGKHEL